MDGKTSPKNEEWDKPTRGLRIDNILRKMVKSERNKEECNKEIKEQTFE